VGAAPRFHEQDDKATRWREGATVTAVLPGDLLALVIVASFDDVLLLLLAATGGPP
jgi:hypothetical protein